MKQVKQAVSQQQDNTLSVESVLIGKHVASFLIPDYNEGQKLAVIDEGVLKYLKNLLPKANPWEIINNFINRLLVIASSPCTLEAAVAEAKDFVAFHESVNLMKKYFDPNMVVIMEKPFNIAEPEPSIDSLVHEWSIMEAKIACNLGGDVSPSEYLMSDKHNKWLKDNDLWKETLQVAQVVADKSIPRK